MNVPLPMQHLATAFWVIVINATLTTLAIFFFGPPQAAF